MDERVENRGVARPHGVEYVAGDDDDLGRELDHAVDRELERSRDISFPLVDATGSEALVLSVAEVEVGEVDKAQAQESSALRRRLSMVTAYRRCVTSG